MDVKDFIKEFRDRMGDTSSSIPEPYIVSYVNTALRRLARTDGLEKLFNRHDTFELSTINADGTAAASWDLGRIGQLLDIPNIKMLCASGGKVHKVDPTFKEFDEFFQMCSLPEQNTPGDPNYYTVEQLGSTNKLVFNRPPSSLVALDMVYSAFHPRILNSAGTIEINYAYCDILTEYCIILHKIESTDMATARALYEDLDVLTTDLKELLAKRKSGLPYRRVRRSF